MPIVSADAGVAWVRLARGMGMVWQDLVGQATAAVGSLEPVHWLSIATAVAFLALVGVLLAKSRTRMDRRRQAVGSAGAREPASVETDPGRALEGIGLSPIDSFFPRSPSRFLILVAVVSVGCWVAGLLLAPDQGRFLGSIEWAIQPFYLAAHFVTLRLFINVYTRNYAAGVARLDLPWAEALRGVKPLVGLPGAAAAVVLALPFCLSELRYLQSPRYERVWDGDGVLAVDYLMWSIWAAEWFMNAFIWVLLVGFMLKNCSTISTSRFRAPIDAVLHDKLYRPFLQMSSQGSTVVLGFSAVTVLYIFATGGELTDYLGLAITGLLLIVCFLPPWLLLRAKVERAVHDEISALRGRAGLGTSAGTVETRSLEQRMEEVTALLKLWHLQNLYGSLGLTEANAIALRLLAPAVTIGWQIVQHSGEWSQRFSRLLAAMGQ